MKKRLLSLIPLLLFALSGCGYMFGSDPAPSTAPETETAIPTTQATLPAPTETETEPETEPETLPPLTPAEALLAQMTTEQKGAQLFFLTPEALSQAGEEGLDNAAGSTALTQRMENALEAYPVGGVVLFGANVQDPDQLTSFLADMQSGASIPLLFAIDEEGGRVARIGQNDAFDVETYPGGMAAVGASGEESQAKNAGLTIGSYLKKYGFHLDFAPVADIGTDNSAIGNRSFGSDPEAVARMVSAQIDGLHEAGILTCMKHFPGHGTVTGDTHQGFVAQEKTWEELLSCDLIPYLSCMDQTDMIMVAHIACTNVCGDDLPASLSREIITERLRKELGYEGVIITDSLSMGAITELYGSTECALMAFQAGADILLMPEDFEESYEAVLSAVQSGEISMERLDESVLRILRLKEAQGLL